jgi:hypothetical protein
MDFGAENTVEHIHTSYNGKSCSKTILFTVINMFVCVNVKMLLVLYAIIHVWVSTCVCQAEIF